MRLPKYFVAFFCIFSIIGFVHGLQVRSQPDVLNRLIESHIVPIDDGSFPNFADPNRGEYKRRVSLSYKCGTRGLISWEIDSKRVNVTEQALYSVLESIGGPQEIIPSPLSTTEIVAVLGGPLGAWTIKDAEKYAVEGESSRLKQFGAAILGGGTGYAAGYWAAMGGLPACDSPKLLGKLRVPSAWTVIERDEAYRVLADAAVITKKISNPVQREGSLKEIYAEMHRLDQPDQVVTSTTFLVASRARYLGDTNNTNAILDGQTERQQYEAVEKALSYFLWGLICVVFLVGARMLVREMNQKELPKAPDEPSKLKSDSLEPANNTIPRQRRAKHTKSGPRTRISTKAK